MKPTKTSVAMLVLTTLALTGLAMVPSAQAHVNDPPNTMECTSNPLIGFVACTGGAYTAYAGNETIHQCEHTFGPQHCDPQVP